MNANGLTLQQMSVAVEIDRVWRDGGAPTSRELSGVRPACGGSSGVTRRRTALGPDAVRSVLKALIRRGIVEQAGVASSGARTWRLTREAEALVEQWRRETTPHKEAE